MTHDEYGGGLQKKGCYYKGEKHEHERVRHVSQSSNKALAIEH